MRAGVPAVLGRGVFDDLARTVSLWKSENGDKYPVGCQPQNEVGLVRYISKKTNRMMGMEWAEARKAIRGMEFLTSENPILNSEVASQKRKRANAKKKKAWAVFQHWGTFALSCSRFLMKVLYENHIILIHGLREAN